MIYSDEAIREARKILRRHKLLEADIEAAVEAAVNLARAKALDLYTAAKRVGQFYEGETDALSRYGVLVSPDIKSCYGKWYMALKLLKKYSCTYALPTGRLPGVSEGYNPIVGNRTFFIKPADEPRRIPGPRLLAAAGFFAALAVLFSIGWLISVL